jgi:hypothetical protein
VQGGSESAPRHRPSFGYQWHHHFWIALVLHIRRCEVTQLTDHGLNVPLWPTSDPPFAMCREGVGQSVIRLAKLHFRKRLEQRLVRFHFGGQSGPRLDHLGEGLLRPRLPGSLCKRQAAACMQAALMRIAWHVRLLTNNPRPAVILFKEVGDSR